MGYAESVDIWKDFVFGEFHLYCSHPPRTRLQPWQSATWPSAKRRASTSLGARMVQLRSSMLTPQHLHNISFVARFSATVKTFSEISPSPSSLKNFRCPCKSMSIVETCLAFSGISLTRMKSCQRSKGLFAGMLGCVEQGQKYD